jgi:hypothetical protein
MYFLLYCVTYFHVNMKIIYLVYVIIYAPCTKFALTFYRDYFNFQVLLPNVHNVLVFAVSYYCCQRLEVVKNWAVRSGIVHLMPCNCLLQISSTHISLCSIPSLILTLSSEISHFLTSRLLQL